MKLPGFLETNCPELTRLVSTGQSLMKLGVSMLRAPAPETDLVLLINQLSRSVHNSMESVLCLASQGFGVDAIRLGRTMFETAVNARYLDEHPKLIRDFVEFIWVKRHRHQGYLKKYSPAEAYDEHSPQAQEIECEYKKVQSRFKGKKDWCDVSLEKRAEAIHASAMYGGLYPVGCSLTHTDILGLRFGTNDLGEITLGPSTAHLDLALFQSGLSYAMTLDVYQKVSELDFRKELDD